MGERVGRYRLGERLGEGGMAEVFRATVEGADGFVKPVAIKRLKPGLDAAGLRREAEIAQTLAHGGLVQVLDYGVADEQPYIVMELVDGCTLGRLAKLKPLPAPVLAFVLEQVAAALAYVHRSTDAQGRARGLVHRDVTPNNILVSRDGLVKLTDFGIAKRAGAEAMTLPGVVQGTPHYASPEQLSGRPLDGRSDVYSLGMVGHALLDDNDASLRSIIAQATEPAPGERYPSADAFRRALEAWRLERGQSDALELAQLVRRALGGRSSPKAIALDLGLSRDLSGPDEPQAVPLAAAPGNEEPISKGLPESVEHDDAPSPARPSGSSATWWRPAAVVMLALASLGMLARALEPPHNSTVPAASTNVSVATGESLEPTEQEHEPTEGEPNTHDSTRLEPTEGEPKTHDSTRLEPTEGDPTRLEPTEGEPKSLDSTRLEPTEGDRSPSTTPGPVVREPQHGRQRTETSTAPQPAAASTTPARPGILEVNVLPYADLEVDGRARGRTPKTLRLRAGRHRIRMHNPQTGQERIVTIRLGAGETVSLRDWTP